MIKKKKNKKGELSIVEVPTERQKNKSMKMHVIICPYFDCTINIQQCWYRRKYKTCKLEEGCYVIKTLEKLLPETYDEEWTWTKIEKDIVED
jgi:hypothetical protein